MTCTTNLTQSPNHQLYFDHLKDRVDIALKQFVPSNYPNSLYRAVNHSLYGKSKRIRPILTYCSYQLFDQNKDNLFKIDPLAAAIEMIHTYSLIHDDLPAMDNDSLRRGQPTCHIAFGEDIAILAGDTLNSLAFEILSQHLPQYFKGNDCLKAIHQISKASGGTGMCGGQVIDIQSSAETLPISELTTMHQMKTGALISTALISPALLCGATPDQISNLKRLGNHLGLLFQITDDILDISSSKDTLGKTPNKDISDNKATYYTILGLEKSQKRAQSEFESAINIISAFTNSGPLIEITHQIFNRQS